MAEEMTDELYGYHIEKTRLMGFMYLWIFQFAGLSHCFATAENKFFASSSDIKTKLACGFRVLTRPI